MNDLTYLWCFVFLCVLETIWKISKGKEWKQIFSKKSIADTIITAIVVMVVARILVRLGWML